MRLQYIESLFFFIWIVLSYKMNWGKNMNKKKILLCAAAFSFAFGVFGLATVKNNFKLSAGENATHFIEFSNDTNKLVIEKAFSVEEKTFLTNEGHEIEFGTGCMMDYEGGWASFNTQWSDIWNKDPIHGMTNISIEFDGGSESDKLILEYDGDLDKPFRWSKTFSLGEDISFDFNGSLPNHFRLYTDVAQNPVKIKSMRIEYSCTDSYRYIDFQVSHYGARMLDFNKAYMPGETVYLDLEVYFGYEGLFEGWYIDGVKVSSNPVYSFTMPDYDITLVANMLEKVS